MFALVLAPASALVLALVPEMSDELTREDGDLKVPSRELDRRGGGGSSLFLSPLSLLLRTDSHTDPH